MKMFLKPHHILQFSGSDRRGPAAGEVILKAKDYQKFATVTMVTCVEVQVEYQASGSLQLQGPQPPHLTS